MEPYDLDAMTAEEARSYRTHKHYSLAHILCSLGRADDLAKLLRMADKVEMDVDARAKDSEEWTAFHYAAFHGYTDCIELLLAHGASMHILNRAGQTPVQLVEDEGLRDILYNIARHQRSIALLVHALTNKLGEKGLVRVVHLMVCGSTSSLRRAPAP